VLSLKRIKGEMAFMTWVGLKDKQFTDTPDTYPDIGIGPIAPPLS
jgi:hypothetical protein